MKGNGYRMIEKMNLKNHFSQQERDQSCSVLFTKTPLVLYFPLYC